MKEYVYMPEGFKNKIYSQIDALKKLKDMESMLESKINIIKEQNEDAIKLGIDIFNLRELENSLKDIKKSIALINKELGN